MKEFIPLAEVPVGKEVIIQDIQSGSNLKARLLAMGLKKGTRVKILQSTGQGPCILLAGRTKFCLGQGMANKILVVRSFR